MPKIIDRRLSRGEIATKAAALFVQEGINNTTMGKVAAACGMSRSNLYLYFESIGSLLNFTIQDTCASLGLRTEALLRDTSIRDEQRLQCFLDDMSSYSSSQRDRVLLIADFMLHPHRSVPGITFDIAQSMRSLRRKLESLVTNTCQDDRQGSDAACLIATALLVLIKNHTLSYSDGGSTRISSVGKDVLQIVAPDHESTTSTVDYP